MTASIADLQHEAAAHRATLLRSVNGLKRSLTPQALTEDVGEAVSARLSNAAGMVSAKAATPAGLIATCALGFAGAFALGGGLGRGGSAPAQASKPDDRSPAPAPLARTGGRDDVIAALLQASAAVAGGVVLSRFLPQTDAERQALAGVGPEVRSTLQRWIATQAQSLVLPKTAQFGPVNLVALAAGLLLSGRKSG